MNRPKSNAQTGREALEGFVVEKFEPRKGRYGCRRVNRGLRRGGTAVGGRRVLAVMRRLGLQAKGTTGKRGRAKPVEKGDPRASPIDRVFGADARNRLWAGDIAYIDADGGRPCLAAATGAWHREVVGWSMPDRISEKLAIDALEQAVGREDPPDGFSPVLRDDRGSQYTSRAFQRCLESHGIAQSMSRPGNPWDNAAAESFFKTLKRELVNDGRRKSKDEARQEAFKCIELYYYNRQRLHSKNGYMAPCDLERDVA